MQDEFENEQIPREKILAWAESNKSCWGENLQRKCSPSELAGPGFFLIYLSFLLFFSFSFSLFFSLFLFFNRFKTSLVYCIILKAFQTQTFVGLILKLLFYKLEEAVFHGGRGRGLIMFSVHFRGHIICTQLFNFLSGLSLDYLPIIEKTNFYISL